MIRSTLPESSIESTRHNSLMSQHLYPTKLSGKRSAWQYMRSNPKGSATDCITNYWLKNFKKTFPVVNAALACFGLKSSWICIQVPTTLKPTQHHVVNGKSDVFFQATKPYSAAQTASNSKKNASCLRRACSRLVSVRSKICPRRLQTYVTTTRCPVKTSRQSANMLRI